MFAQFLVLNIIILDNLRGTMCVPGAWWHGTSVNDLFLNFHDDLPGLALREK